MVINLISSPRNISTALMYSFANRADTKVMDEPFYAYYLNLTGADHPGKAEIIASQPTSVEGVIKWISEMESKHEIVFIKNMAHHLIQMDTGFLSNYKNAFLIRHPKQLISSFSKVIETPKMSDIGIERQQELFTILGGKSPVLDSNEVLKNPSRVLSHFCASLSIPFDLDMLAWPAGPIKEDGIWAKYWYDNVHASSGFSKKTTKETSFPDHCQELYKQSLPYFEQMFAKAIKATN
ncbi:MAG: sulfotransferase family protein [Marinoscillum sp.]